MKFKLYFHNSARACVCNKLRVASKIAFFHFWFKAFPVCFTFFHFFIRNFKFNCTVVHIKFNDVTIFNKCDRTAFSSFWRNMSN